MVEGRSFIDKELHRNLDDVQENIPETKKSVPIYTPPPHIQEQKKTEPQPQQTVVQIVERIIYKKQRIHGFFRTLTIIALLAIGFLMLGESTGMLSLSINSFKLHQIFPIVIILSSIIIRSYKGIFGKLFWLILFLTVRWWLFTISVYTSLNPSTKWKWWTTINYTLSNVDKTTGVNLYLQTLAGSSSIQGGKKKSRIEWSWNSDKDLSVSSGEISNTPYIKFNENTDRNLLQKNVSKLNLALPEDTMFNHIYIKNLIWSPTIDLTSLQRKTLTLHAGLDDMTIDIGNVLSGNALEIQGAAAEVQINIPQDIGVMMYYKSIVGLIINPEFNELSGHYYQSQNFTDAKAILNVYINLGVWKTTINRMKSK